MLNLERVALELLEYKIDALANRREYRGGISGLWDLFRVVDRGVAQLDADERGRFHEAARRLRAVAELPTRGGGRRADLDALTLMPDGGGMLRHAGGQDGDGGDALLETDAPAQVELSRDAREEQRALQSLAERVGREELDDLVGRLAAAWRAERERITPRLVYATVRNLQRHAETVEGPQATSARAFKVVERIPERRDPLISLSDLDSLAEVGRDLVDLILTLGRPDGRFSKLDVPEAQALDFVRQVATRVAQDPYAGHLSPIERKGPTTSELRTAIQELAKERLPEAQRSVLRNDLEARLNEALSYERQQRQSFQRDAERNVEAVRLLFERLEPHLPARVGGGAPPRRLAGGVLFAVSSALRWERVPRGAEALTLRMVGPVRFTLGGHVIAVMGSGDTRTLFVDDEAHPLATSMVVPVGRGEVRVDREGEYVHVRWRDGGRSAAARLAEALVVAHVVTHERHAAFLAVLGAIANVAGGAPIDVVTRAVQTAAAVTAGAPNRRQALEGLVRGAAKATGTDLEDNAVLGLVQRMQTSMSVEPGDLAALLEREELADGIACAVGEEPVTADVGPLRLTVRRYRGRGRGSVRAVGRDASGPGGGGVQHGGRRVGAGWGARRGRRRRRGRAAAPPRPHLEGEGARVSGGAPKVADPAAVTAAVAAAPDWRLAEDGALVFERRFASVADAVGFLVSVALHAERHGHHPETAWTYRDVSMRLVTHDAGDRVTDRDLALLGDLAALR